MVSGPLQPKDNPVRLETWKAIADFLGRSCRTAQRWHVEFGLPIYRAGGKRSNVFAFPDELRAWMIRRPDLPAGGSDVTSIGTPTVHGDPGTDPRVPASQAAAELVTKAEMAWRALSSKNVGTMTSLFRAATELDPSNPRAYAGLAHSLIFQGLLGALHIPDAYHSAGVAAEFAASLAASEPQTKSPAAWIKVVHERDWDGAYSLFRELASCDSTSTLPCTGFGLLLIAAGQVERAGELLYRAARRNALSAAYRGLHCWTDYLARDFVQAQEHVTQSRLAAQEGDTIRVVEALLLLQTQAPEDALPNLHAMFRQNQHHPLFRAAIAHALATTGQTEKASQILEELRRHRSHAERIPYYSIAIALIGLERYEEAVMALERSYVVGSLFSLGFHADPILAPLHSHPDFQTFVRSAYPLDREFP